MDKVLRTVLYKNQSIYYFMDKLKRTVMDPNSNMTTLIL